MSVTGIDIDGARTWRPRLTACVVGVLASLALVASAAADGLLTGRVTAQAGEALGGVPVYAQRTASTITTTVYTDDTGRYYFPLLPAGTYRVWAQTLGFDLQAQTVTLATRARQDLVLPPITDPERRFRQLPSELMMAALPDATPADARMKKIFTSYCTNCHPIGYTLQFKFDEPGWKKIIDVMKVGANFGPNARVDALIEHNAAELATYLARARGPAASSMKPVSRPRPTGEATRAVWTLYDVPMNPDVALKQAVAPLDGTDWSLGYPAKLGAMDPHDSNMGGDGHLYYTINNAHKHATIGKVDTTTGVASFFEVPASDRLAASSHGSARDARGNWWFDVNLRPKGRHSLAKLDVATQKITVYEPPADITEVGYRGTTVDVDGQGGVWVSSLKGALRFDPATERFTDFVSKGPLLYPTSTGEAYGVAGDRDGNGWWAEMIEDTVGHGEVATKTVSAVKIAPNAAIRSLFTPADHAYYDTFTDMSINSMLPWSQGPRRMGADKSGDTIWVGNAWGNSLSAIHTKTKAVDLVRLPEPTMQPYHIAVDSHHQVWGDMWTIDQLFKYDPGTKQWTIFDLPVHGSETRHIEVSEKDGRVVVTMPVTRSSKMGVLTVRTPADLDALKALDR